MQDRKETREESRVDQELGSNTRLSDGHEQDPEEGDGDCRITRALDPQFAEPTHVYPPCPIVRPFTIYVHT
jgi:hypothetical protein